MEIFVFDNIELRYAFGKGYRSIALCDNSFTVPGVSDIEYWSIGSSDIIAPPKDFCEKNGIRFMNFTPHYSQKMTSALSDKTSGDRTVHHAENTNTDTGSVSSSFAKNNPTVSSAAGLLSSYTYRSSFTGSFVLSLSGSFQSSLTGSFTSSLAGSLSSVLAGSFAAESGSVQTADIKVFGYGINLI